MSRQLAITSALSIMAMAMLVVFGTAPARDGAFAPQAEVAVNGSHLPSLLRVLAGN